MDGSAPTRDARVVAYLSPDDAAAVDQLAADLDISRSAAARVLLRKAIAAGADTKAA